MEYDVTERSMPAESPSWTVGGHLCVLEWKGAGMDDRAHHRAADLARIIGAVGVLIIAICCVVFVAWLALSEQTTKLYESDNVVCASQPFALTCFERKAR